MKLHTQIWTRMESVGKPQFTRTFHGTTRETAMHIAGWLSEVHMGTHLKIRIARTEAELCESSRQAAIEDMTAELDAMLGGTPEGDNNEPEIGLCRHNKVWPTCRVCNS